MPPKSARLTLEPGPDRFFADMKGDEQDGEDQRLAEHDPREYAPFQALAEFERLGDQDDLAEDQRVHDGEALLPDADAVHQQHLPPVQAEEREQEPEIDGDDGVFLELADCAFPQALLACGGGRSRGGVCDVLHGSASARPADMPARGNMIAVEADCQSVPPASLGKERAPTASLPQESGLRAR